MANRDIENASDREKVERMRAVLNRLSAECTRGNEMCARIKIIFSGFYRSFNSIKARRRHSDEWAIASLNSNLLITCENMKTVESKLKVIENEIRFLRLLIDSTSENPESTFQKSKKRMIKIFQDVAVELKESMEKLKVIRDTVRGVE